MTLSCYLTKYILQIYFIVKMIVVSLHLYTLSKALYLKL